MKREFHLTFGVKHERMKRQFHLTFEGKTREDETLVPTGL